MNGSIEMPKWPIRGQIFALISTHEMSMLFLSMHFVSSHLARKVHLLHCSLITFSGPLFHKYSKGLCSISIDQTTTSPEGANSGGSLAAVVACHVFCRICKCADHVFVAVLL